MLCNNISEVSLTHFTATIYLKELLHTYERLACDLHESGCSSKGILCRLQPLSGSAQVLLGARIGIQPCNAQSKKRVQSKE